MIRLFAFLLLSIAAIATPAAAQTISPADHAAIATRITAFDTMMKEGRIGDSLDFVPPRLLAAIAKKFNVAPSEFKASFAAQIAEMIKDVKFVSFGMDLAAATTAVTPDNSRTYLLIPTETVMDISGGTRMQSKTVSVALKDGDAWYLVRIDDAEQVTFLREAFPEFAGVEFPKGSMSVVKPE